MLKPDFRLTFLVGIFWLGAIAGFKFFDQNYLLILIIGISFGLGVYRLPTIRTFLLLATLGFILAFGTAFIRVQQIQSLKLIQSGEIVFRVLEDPRKVPKAFGLAGENEIKVLVDAQASASPVFPLLLTVSEESFASAKISSVWKCEANIEQQFKPRRYSGYGECLESPTKVQQPTYLQVLGDVFRSSLRSLTSDKYVSDAAALLPGLVLGDTSAQSSRLENTLQAAGLGHLTAVSGANVAIVLVGLELVLRLTKVRLHTRLLILAVGVLFFMVVVRPSPSVVRATAMALFGLVSLWFGKARLSLLLLNLTGITLLALDPFLAVSLGFQLSYAATFGLIVFPKLFQVPVDANFWVKALITAAAAALATLPILIAAGLEPTFATIPANMLADGLVAPATLAGVIAAVVGVLKGVPIIGWVFEWLASFAADFGLLPAALILFVAGWAERSFFQVPFQSPTGLMLLLATAGFGWLLHRKNVGKQLIAIGLSIFLTSGLWLGNRSIAWGSSWDVAVCDVGQGDATVLRGVTGEFVLIDAGPDETSLDKCLRSLGISKINLFIASHFHADHVAAVSLLKEYAVDVVWLPSATSPENLSELVRVALSDAQLITPAAGAQLQIGGWLLQVLQNPDLAVTDDGTSINNASLVVAAEKPNSSLLFTGDIEEAAQTELMRTFPNSHFKILKVPHHGSSAQNPHFVFWSRAKLAWVSAGLDNPYGHPSPKLVANYRAAGVTLYSTIDCGQLGFQLQHPNPQVLATKACNPL